MICPKCGIEAIISRGGYRLEGDKSAETESRLFRVLEFSCRNPGCDACGESIGREEIQLDLE